jgi:hypothetical protein
MHDAISTLLVLLMGLGLTLAGVVLLVSRGALRSRLRRTPRTLARQAQAGTTVKMIGKVVAREPVHAPLANVACAYFQMTVQQVSEQDRETLETQFTERAYAQGWELEDESGRIAVEPEEAQFLHIRLREFSPGAAVWDPNIQRDLVSRYILTRSADGMRLREERLDLGTTVVALGRVEESPAGLVLTGGPELELYGEDEKALTAIKLADLGGWVLLMTGLLLCATWALSLRSQSDEPLPNMKAMPIPRPPAPSPSTPRHP